MKEEALKLRAQGKTYKEIQDITGLAKSTISYYCATDGKGNTLNRQKKRRREIKVLLEELKASKGCKYCSETHPAALDFHHHSDDKEFTIGQDAINKKLSNKRILEEVAKCEVVCANCHRKIHYNPNSYL